VNKVAIISCSTRASEKNCLVLHKVCDVVQRPRGVVSAESSPGRVWCRALALGANIFGHGKAPTIRGAGINFVIFTAQTCIYNCITTFMLKCTKMALVRYTRKCKSCVFQLEIKTWDLASWHYVWPHHTTHFQ